MPEKIFKGYVILNWKNGSFRVKKTNPIKTLKPTEIPISLTLKVKTPEKPPITKIDGEIEISSTKVKQLILETLEDDTSIE